MSLWNDLIDLYENNQDFVGDVESKRVQSSQKDESFSESYTLLPLYHIQKGKSSDKNPDKTSDKKPNEGASIEITIDQKGMFQNAVAVSKNDDFVLLPVPLDALARTNATRPYALCDELQYIAKGLDVFFEGKKEKELKEKYNLYINQLNEWHESEYTTDKVDAIYTYLSNGTIIDDLKKTMPDLFNDLPTIGKRIVRFIVFPDDFTQENSKCWEDKNLINKYIEYYESKLAKENSILDYFTGEIQSEQLNKHHPQMPIVNGRGTAKIICGYSSSDGGIIDSRFDNLNNVCNIGAKSSQKIHNALRWIYNRQGKQYGNITIITWENQTNISPAWDAGTDEIMIDDDYAFDEEEIDHSVDTNQETAKKIFGNLSGGYSVIDNASEMRLLVLGAATSGRVSVQEYQTLNSIKYLQNITSWHMECSWIHKTKSHKIYLGIPSVQKMSKMLFDDDKALGPFTKRILSCIWYNRPLPYDYVCLAVNKTSNPLAFWGKSEDKNKSFFEKETEWKDMLSLACSFIKKHRYDRYKEEWKVSLSKECTDRNYLYGRLLAVADRVEYLTYTEADKGRITNAKRYMNVFSQRPFDTWKIIEENIQPYMSKLIVGTRIFYQQTIDDIMSKFSIEEFTNNSKLDGLYLLGFHSQSYAMNKKNTEEENN